LRYAGYRSFDHLEAGADYRSFGLASETDRVPPYAAGVSEAQEARRLGSLTGSEGGNRDAAA
jgi:hypothetical protein